MSATDGTTGPDRALQLAAPAAVPAEVAATAIDILTGDLTMTQWFTLAIEALQKTPNVDRVVAVTTTVRPDREDAWIRLGDRAWLMERIVAGLTATGAPGKDVGSSRAMSMPWFSQQARRSGVVGITDTRLLDGPAAQDRVELEANGVAAVLGCALICDGVMYGSIAVSRSQPGSWPEESVAAVSMLGAALAARMSASRDRAALVDAIARADQARDSQHQFFSALGHELRTPISAIIGTAEILGMEAGELVDLDAGSGGAHADVASFAAGVVKDSTVVLGAAEQLLAVIDSLLQTGQEVRGRVGEQAVDVSDAVRDVVHWLNAPALAAGVTVSVAPDISACVATTPSALRQILANLVGNAIAHNHRAGKVRVSTSSSTDEHGSARVRITVRDTGPGLTHEQQGEVFKPFVRFAEPGVRGTGLGLALSRSLAERDGGLMGVESAPGQGAAFWVDLPAAVARRDGVARR